MARKPESKTEAEILEVSQGEVHFFFVGTSPLIFNRMAEKQKRTLLMGSTKMNAAEKASNIKHNPAEEFRASVYRNTGLQPETRLCFPSAAAKGVIKTAALDMPGTTKAGLGRRVWAPGNTFNIWGIPQMLISVVRSADIARTPDMRTRAIVPAWCAEIVVRFAAPLVTERQIARLFAAGGILCGIGDWRQEKGSGSFGQFRLCAASDPEFKKIQREGGCAAQDRALEKIICYDFDTEDMLDRYSTEIVRLGRDKKGGKPFLSSSDDEASEAA